MHRDVLRDVLRDVPVGGRDLLAGGVCWGLVFVGRVAVWLLFERLFLRPSVIVVPVRGSGWWVCLSAAGFRVHNPAAPQASSTPASRSKGKSQIKDQINSKINSKIKNCDEEPGLRRAS
ncbi:hypothetical protein KGQ20_34070, partial [Catenulispora sp. NF23]|uniref:hypothetical protein n=1 Tax=Catenulispora pinistramenti TaxID=2705254 RepID=UPI001BAA64C2